MELRALVLIHWAFSSKPVQYHWCVDGGYLEGYPQWLGRIVFPKFSTSEEVRDAGRGLALMLLLSTSCAQLVDFTSVISQLFLLSEGTTFTISTMFRRQDGVRGWMDWVEQADRFFDFQHQLRQLSSSYNDLRKSSFDLFFS
jgi:hypothetical protein